VRPQPTHIFIVVFSFTNYIKRVGKTKDRSEELNEMHGALLMNHIKMAITTSFAKLYYGKVDILDLPADLEENLLVFDLSDKTKFSRHIIIPGVHVENHMEARAFANEVVRNMDDKLCPVIDLGIYKSLQNFRLFNNRKVGSPRVKQCKSSTFH